GMRIKSATRAAAKAAASECGAVSIMAKTAPCAAAVSSTCANRATGVATTAGVSAVRRSFQLVALAWGSRSITATALPAALAATAKWTASVVFPAPPFCEMIAIVFMCTNLHEELFTCQFFYVYTRIHVNSIFIERESKEPSYKGLKTSPFPQKYNSPRTGVARKQ